MAPPKRVKNTMERLNIKGVNKPKRTPDHPRKSSVVMAKQGDDYKLVRFGDPDMKIKKNDPERKKSYCARSGGIKGKNNKLSANYWSRKAWNC